MHDNERTDRFRSFAIHSRLFRRVCAAALHQLRSLFSTRTGRVRARLSVRDLLIAGARLRSEPALKAMAPQKNSAPPCRIPDRALQRLKPAAVGLCGPLQPIAPPATSSLQLTADRQPARPHHGSGPESKSERKR